MRRETFSEADLRLTAKAIRSYAGQIEHGASRHGRRIALSRIAQLERLELLYLELADAKAARRS